MTAEQLIRDQLDRATRDVPNSPRPGDQPSGRAGAAACNDVAARRIAAVAVLGIGTIGLPDRDG